MRSVPIGILPDLETVVEYAKINAKLTHNTTKGITSSITIALTSHYLLYQKEFHGVGKEIDNETFGYIFRILRMVGAISRILASR